MDENPQSFQEKKDLLEKELANALLDAVEKQEIKLVDMKPVAKEVLAEFDKASNSAQLVGFLESISKRWSFFSNLYHKYKGVSQQDKEKQVVEKLSSYIRKS